MGIQTKGNVMGYETTLYIVEKYSSLHPANTIVVKGQNGCASTVHQVYNKEGKDFYYLEDGNTRVEVKNPVTVPSHTCHVLAMIEMSKMGIGLGSICKFEDSHVHCFRPCNGNAYLPLDPYGDYRNFVPIQQAIDIIAEVNKTAKYRRFDMALAIMRSVKRGFKANLANIGILEYGH